MSTLSYLTVSPVGVSPSFRFFRTSYNVGLKYSQTSITIIANPTDSSATMTVNGVELQAGVASSSIPINVGSNQVVVQCVAQDGVAITSYSITVVRAECNNKNTKKEKQ